MAMGNKIINFFKTEQPKPNMESGTSLDLLSDYESDDSDSSTTDPTETHSVQSSTAEGNSSIKPDVQSKNTSSDETGDSDLTVGNYSLDVHKDTPALKDNEANLNDSVPLTSTYDPQNNGDSNSTETLEEVMEADGEEEGEREVGTCKFEGCNSKCNKKNDKYMEFCTRRHHQMYKKSKKSAQPAHTKVQELKYNQQPKKGEGKEERKQNTEEAKKDTAVKSVPLERNSLKRPIQPSSAPDHPGQEDKSSIQCSDCNQPLSSDKEKEEFCDKCLKSQLQICNDDTPTTTPTNTPTKGPPLKTQIDVKRTCKRPKCGKLLVGHNGQPLETDICQWCQGKEKKEQNKSTKPKRGQSKPKTQSVPTCKLPGCNKPCYVEGSRVHDFCGKSHAMQHTDRGGRYNLRSTNQQAKTSSQQQETSWTNMFWDFWSSTKPSNNLKDQKGPINFYHRHEPYFEFTNFFEAPIIINDKKWATAENYFQGQKFIGSPFEEAVRQCSTAREALNLSRLPEVKQWQRKDWFEANVDVMRVGLYAKFTQHRDLQELLLGTGKREIIEHTDKDRFWGDGGDGSGENMLGKLLVKLRKKLREELEDMEKNVIDDVGTSVDSEPTQKNKRSRSYSSEGGQNSKRKRHKSPITLM